MYILIRLTARTSGAPRPSKPVAAGKAKGSQILTPSHSDEQHFASSCSTKIKKPTQHTAKYCAQGVPKESNQIHSAPRKTAARNGEPLRNCVNVCFDGARLIHLCRRRSEKIGKDQSKDQPSGVRMAVNRVRRRRRLLTASCLPGHWEQSQQNGPDETGIGAPPILCWCVGMWQGFCVRYTDTYGNSVFWAPVQRLANSFQSSTRYNNFKIEPYAVPCLIVRAIIPHPVSEIIIPRWGPVRE